MAKQVMPQQYTPCNNPFQAKRFMWNSPRKKYPKEPRLNFGKIYGEVK